MSEPSEPERPPDATGAAPSAEHYYRGTITRVYYGSESGTLTSDTSHREYQFKFPGVQILGPIPRIDGLRVGMSVGFDVGWTSRGLRVTVIRVYD